MRIAIDLDGTICSIKKPYQSYADLKPLPGAVELIKKLKRNNHYIIIVTARHMATCNSNMGVLIKKIAKITLDWLEKYDIEYDEIYFGKPNADIYIDDRAIRFNKWEEINEGLLETLARER